MASCHGNGNLDSGGCCYVNGQVCVHRVTAANVTTFVNSLGLSGAKKTQAAAMANKVLQAVTNACGIAAKVLIADPSLINDRAAFDAAWDNHPDYLVTPGPVWRALEVAQNRAPLSYQCSTWGPGSPQCCFAEAPAVNDAKLAALDVQQVTLRRNRRG